MRSVFVGLGLVAVTLAISRTGRLRLEKEVAVAALRALVQLGLVAVVISAVFDNVGLSGLFVLVMLTAGTITSGRRLRGVPGRYGTALAAIVVGALLALVPLFVLGEYGLEPRFLIPISGIVIGGAMTATSLAGSRTRDELRSRKLELEARLALGVTAAFAFRPYLTASVRTALIPVIDQTKNVGLITLPGAFVGMMLGGASPADAAKVQLTVLFSLLGAEIASASVVARLVGRAFIAPGERLALDDPGALGGNQGRSKQ